MVISTCDVTNNQDKKELNPHGDISFPIACYEEDLTEFYVPWHWHDDFEFIMTTEGAVEVFVENDKITLFKGEAIFINSGALHSVNRKKPMAGTIRSLVFNGKLIGGSMDSIFWQKLIRPLLDDRSFRCLYLDQHCGWQSDIAADMDTAWEALAEETDDYENITRYYLSKAFRTLNMHRPSIIKSISSQEQLMTDRMKAMLQYIETHYMNELTIAMIADSISVSESVCLRCFRKMIGTTPIQYVKQFRIKKAAEMLLTTDEKISAIGIACGFSDISYFTKTFRTQKGYTPNEYRKKHRTVTI